MMEFDLIYLSITWEKKCDFDVSEFVVVTLRDIYCMMDLGIQQLELLGI
jgi:hypothetical protein